MAAQFQITIVVDASQGKSAAKDVGDALDQVKSKANETQTAIKEAFAVYEVYEAAKAVLELADSYQEIQNRLRAVAVDQANLNGLTGSTLDVANATRVSWEKTAETYQRLQVATRDMGTSQKDVIALTKELNQAFQITGSTTQQQERSVMQLAKAFGTGSMNGREFNTFLKNNFGIVDDLAKSLGMTTNQFVMMGKQGQLTGDMLMKAFQGAAGAIDDKFAKLIPTVAGAWTVLTNQAEAFFGAAGTGSGVLAGLANMILFVANHFDTFGKIAIVVAQVLGVAGLLKAIGMVIDGLRLLGAAALANPFTALLFAVVAVVAVLRQFGDQMDAGLGKGIKVSDVLHTLWEDIKQLAAVVGEFVSGAWEDLTRAFDDGLDAKGIELSFSNVILFIATFVQTAINLLRGVGDVIMDVFSFVVVFVF